MRTYRGTAVLLLDDGTERSVAASIDKDDTGTWSGHLGVPAAEQTPEFLNLAEGRVSIGESTGSFIRTNTSDWLDSPEGWCVIRIEGSGDAPF